MQRIVASALVASALGTSPAHAQLVPFRSDAPIHRDLRFAAAEDPRAPSGNLGGGFIEFLFGDALGLPARKPMRPLYPAQPAYGPTEAAQQFELNSVYRRQVVDYAGSEKPGTIIIDTPDYFLYLVLEDGKALRYGIGVGRPGFTWAGVKRISAKREWPDWRPPEQMLQRRPDLPHYMPGGPENPLGARAMYLGDTLYRIHGSNEPWTIGTQVSSGCIRMNNQDVIDLYERVRIGTRVVVI